MRIALQNVARAALVAAFLYPAWRVFLEPVVGFNYLHVVAVSEKPCRLSRLFEQNIDTNAHVRRNYARDLARELCGLIELLTCKSGCPYHHGPAVCGCGPQVFER